MVPLAPPLMSTTKVAMPPPTTSYSTYSATFTSPTYEAILKSKNLEDLIISSQSIDTPDNDVIELWNKDQTIEDFDFGLIPFDNSAEDMTDNSIISVMTEMLEKMFVDHETKVKKIVDDSLIEIHDGLSEFKSYVEVQIMLKTCVDQFSLDIKTLIEDVRSFNKDYTMKMLQTDETYLKPFQDLKLSTAMLEKMIHTFNLPHNFAKTPAHKHIKIRFHSNHAQEEDKVWSLNDIVKILNISKDMMFDNAFQNIRFKVVRGDQYFQMALIGIELAKEFNTTTHIPRKMKTTAVNIKRENVELMLCCMSKTSMYALLWDANHAEDENHFVGEDIEVNIDFSEEQPHVTHDYISSGCTLYWNSIVSNDIKLKVTSKFNSYGEARTMTTTNFTPYILSNDVTLMTPSGATISPPPSHSCHATFPISQGYQQPQQYQSHFAISSFAYVAL
ncbi:unnamed protein product [Lactuca saligna]|uniref:Uncharacterized protein n=1 Tax=Lactuca saligna TaxID=75948 RepID=A0AA35ZVA4_LACSI|nr:unnamed protein product [Lactuca saligna]